MAFARVQPSSLGGTPNESGASSPGSTQVLTSAVSGHWGILWVNVWTNMNTAVSLAATITDNQGNTWTKRSEHKDNQSLSSENTTIYDCPISTGGNISLDPSSGASGVGSSVQWEFAAAEYSGQDASPVDAVGGVDSHASGNSLSESTSTTTSATTELAVANFTTQGSGSNVVWGGLGTWVNVYRQNNNSTAQACQFSDDVNDTGLHSVTATATATTSPSGTWCAAMATYKVSAGGGGGFTPKARRTLAWVGRVGRRSSAP